MLTRGGGGGGGWGGGFEGTKKRLNERLLVDCTYKAAQSARPTRCGRAVVGGSA